MISQATCDACAKIYQSQRDPIIMYKLGIACGMIERALPGVDPGSEILERIRSLNPPVEEVVAIVGEWIEIRDQMRRTRLRRKRT